jgi:dTDP-4-amino-4,6-dideoxygalactose transaminase
VFIDVLPDTFNIDPKSLAAAIAMVRREGKLRPAVIMAVDLFGQPADYRRIEPIAEREGLKVLCDSAQGFGATLDGKQTVSFGQAAGTSFFPAKPLGCYGDGGCCFTSDDELAVTLRSLRVHGQGSGKYDNVRIGVNSRLDTIQAAILIEKLRIFPEEIELRNRVAQRYAQGLAQSNRVRVPAVIDRGLSTWAQYTLVLENRQKVQTDLKERSIPTAVYYSLPLNRQRAYCHYPVAPGGVSVSDSLSENVISLPMHPYLSDDDVDRIAEAILVSLEHSR